MSILVSKIRPILFSNLRPDFDPKLRAAVWNLFNAVDSDLDIAGYIESSTTDEALEELESTMSGNHIPDMDDSEFLPPTQSQSTDEPPAPTYELDDDELTSP